MPRSRKWTDNAERQAAYRKRQRAEQVRLLQQKGLPPLPRIAQMPGTARWSAATRAGLTLLCTVRDEMQTWFDERSEAWRESDKAEAFQERIDAIEEIVSLLEALD